MNLKDNVKIEIKGVKTGLAMVSFMTGLKDIRKCGTYSDKEIIDMTRHYLMGTLEDWFEETHLELEKKYERLKKENEELKKRN